MNLDEAFKGSYIFMDNAFIHKSKPMLRKIESISYKVMYLPPFSPVLKEQLIEFYYEYPQAFERFFLKKTSASSLILYDCNLAFKRVTPQPLARNSDEQIRKRFRWITETLKTGMNYLANCVFADETAFNIKLRTPYRRSPSCISPTVETLSVRAISHIILGTISSQGVKSVEVNEPLKPKKIKVSSSRKRKNAPAIKKKITGTNTDHYMRLVFEMLDEMDKFPEMESFYIIMDNATIHRLGDGIDGTIERRGYRIIHLLLYSPELNPIEQPWALLKSEANSAISRT